MQRPADLARGALAIERVGSLQRRRVQRDEGIDARPLLIVRLDACEIALDELPRSDLLLRERRLKLVDRFLEEIEAGFGERLRPARG